MYEYINFQDSTITFKITDGSIELKGKWLFEKMSKLGWNIHSYSSEDKELSLYGKYQRDRLLEIKKFFFDNYPHVMRVRPKEYVIYVDFFIPVNFTMN